MKPPPFEYEAPDRVEAVLALLAEHGDRAKLLAGGQSLIPAMNFRLAQPAVLVDINSITELAFIRRENGGALHIGAMTRQRQIERDPLVAAHAPLLYEAMPFIAHPQIRNRGTIGGSLAHADPAAELPVVAVTLGARIRIRSQDAERWVDASSFFLGMFATDLKPDEMLVEVVIPALPARTGWCFLEFARRRGDYALMGVAALVTLDEGGVCRAAKLVYLNASDRPADAAQSAALLVGQTRSAEVFEAAAAKAADEEINPFGNIHASAAFQRHLARVLTQQALAAAFDRAASAKGI